MLEAARQGFLAMMAPQMLGLMGLGIMISMLFQVVPGMGAIVPLSLLLPFVATMQPYQAIALLIALTTLANTATAFSSILIGVPGSSGSVATIVDGYPMAARGEAARALGAAFTASAMGGVFGALVLLGSIPIMRPLVLSLGSPELLMLVVWGLTMVGVLSTGAPLKGIIAAIVGVLISTVGLDVKSGVPRFVFGQPYLWDGIKLTLIALGAFAVPELMSLAVRKTSIARERPLLGSGMLQGVRDALAHWVLVLRCSAVGVWFGFLPGLGGPVVDWMAYAQAVQSARDREGFGSGDVRGVIGPESGVHAKEGGSLIPTLGFGIPGSAGFALVLVALISVGLNPGPELISGRLDIVFAIVTVMLICSVVGSAIALGLTPVMAKVVFLPFRTIVPVILTICVVAAYTASFSLDDLVVLALASVLGVLMKEFGWPRPPLLVGVILGRQAELYLWLSVQRYGYQWMLRPGVLVLAALVVLTLVYSHRTAASGRQGRGGDAAHAAADR